MKARTRNATTRNVLTAASAVYLAVAVRLIGRVQLGTLNLLLVGAVVPLVWLIWAFCRWSAYQHARAEARAIERMHKTPVVGARRQAVRR